MFSANNPIMPALDAPLTFRPLFFERVWGGRKLASHYRKDIPAERHIGESWEIVDRPEAQSMVESGALSGRSLHDLWVNYRADIFGEVNDRPRFPLLIKLLDCREKLSLQVHPPAPVAAALKGEPKSECWYIADATLEAELYLGFSQPASPNRFRQAISDGTAAELIHRVPVGRGDAFFIPSGRIHAIGAGNLIVEVQQNSDTTFRVFDWNRCDKDGKPRELHIEEALSCIDFEDSRPAALEASGETILAHELFTIERWALLDSRPLVAPGEFSIAFCLSGTIRCAGMLFYPGNFFLMPAGMTDRLVEPGAAGTKLLRITL